MKIVRWLLMMAIIVPACAIVTAGQEQTSAPAPKSPPKIETKFDSGKNETTVELRALLIRGTETEKILISVTGTFATRTPKKHPEQVIFIISVLSTEYKYPDVGKLLITSDGKTLAPILLVNFDRRPAEPLCLETLGTRIDFDVFMKMAKGKAVQLQFGETSVELRPDHLELLSSLADLLHT